MFNNAKQMNFFNILEYYHSNIKKTITINYDKSILKVYFYILYFGEVIYSI